MDSIPNVNAAIVRGIFLYRSTRPEIDVCRVLNKRMLSMIGVPPTCGFFSKYFLIRGGIEAGHWLYVVALLVSSLVNAILFFRIIEKAFFGDLSAEETGHGHGHDEHGHDEGEPSVIDEAPLSMVAPLVIAAGGLLFIGLNTREIVTVIEQTLNLYALTGGGG